MKQTIDLINAQWNNDPDYPGLVKVDTDKLTTASFGIFQYQDTVHIVFRATATTMNIILDAFAYPFLKDNEFHYHPGFYLSYFSLKNELYPILAKLNYNNIVLHGHSLGAAMAGICAIDMKKNGYPVTELNLLACPRFVNKAGIKYLSTLKINSFINGNDYVWFVAPFLSHFKFIRIGKPKWWKLFSFTDHVPWNMGKSTGYEQALKETPYW